MVGNNPCEVCGGSECSYHDVHAEVFECPVCKAEYDEFAPEFGLVIDEMFRRAGLKQDNRLTVCRLADWLESQAANAATKSRDFGRGFSYAARMLRQFRP